MPTILERFRGLPTTPEAQAKFVLTALDAILDRLTSLVTLDRALRVERSEGSERALVFLSAVVTGAAPTTIAALWPQVVNQVYTTALIQFDATGGTARWRMDGAPPLPVAAAASGMPVPAGFSTMNIVGALNIRSFQVVAEPAQTLNMSITLFQ